MRFRYNFVILNDFIIKANLKTSLIMKRVINLNVNVNKEIAMSLLNILNNHFIALKTTFDEILFKIEMKLNKFLTFFFDNCIPLLTLFL